MRCLILLFVLIICMKEGFGDDGMTRMSGFGVNMMTFYHSIHPSTDLDRAKVGCYLIFCHWDDKNSCINNEKPGCKCRIDCKRFSYLHTNQNHYVRKDSYTLWKEPSECENEYFGSLIECWTPLEFKSAWEQYVESYCFGANSYTFPSEDEIEDRSERSARTTSVYQWVPVILVAQAIMFYLPHFIWLLINKLTGVDLECVTTDAGMMRKLPEDQRKSVAERIATYLYDASFTIRCSDRRIFKCINGNWCAAALYCSTKIAYIANLLLQILLITYIVGNGNPFWAFKATNSPAFPQETLCDVAIRRSGGLSRYTIQCTLSINELNEMIYRFLWFWFMTVLSVSLVNLIYTAYHIFIPSVRVSTCKRWLSTRQTTTEDGENLMINRFAFSGVQPDTTLAMRFIEAEAGAIVTKEFADALFQKFTNDLSLANDTPSTTVVHGNK